MKANNTQKTINMKNKQLQLFFLLVFLILGIYSSAQIHVVDNKGNILKIDTSKWVVGTNGVDIFNKNIDNSGKVGVGIKMPAATFHNAGSTILGMTVASNTAATYTPAVSTVDNYSGLVLTQTSMACALTLPTPTNATTGRIFILTNAVTSAFPITVGTYTLPAGQSGEFVWNGTSWSAPSVFSSTVPFNGLIDATAPNTEDNKNFAQTWNWTTANIQSPLTINSNSLTTGTLLGLNANALTTGVGLNLASTGTTLTGNLLNATTASTSAFTNGGVRFNFSGAHTGTGFQIDDATTSGAAQAINATGTYTGTGLWTLNANSASTGTVANINANALTTGTALNISSNSTALVSGGQLLNIVTSGVNTTASSTTTAATITNVHTGTTATNVGLSLSASGGTYNYALKAAGDVLATRYLATMPSSITAASTTTLDLSAGNVFNIDVGANIGTLTINNAPANPESFVIKLAYASSTAYTINWPATFKWSGGAAPTLTCTSGKVDIVSIMFDGTNYYCSYGLSF